MKEKIFNFLNNRYYLSDMDKDICEKFLIDFFEEYQPERSKREDTRNKPVNDYHHHKSGDAVL